MQSRQDSAARLGALFAEGGRVVAVAVAAPVPLPVASSS